MYRLLRTVLMCMDHHMLHNSEYIITPVHFADWFLLYRTKLCFWQSRLQPSQPLPMPQYKAIQLYLAYYTLLQHDYLHMPTAISTGNELRKFSDIFEEEIPVDIISQAESDKQTHKNQSHCQRLGNLVNQFTSTKYIFVTHWTALYFFTCLYTYLYISDRLLMRRGTT